MKKGETSKIKWVSLYTSQKEVKLYTCKKSGKIQKKMSVESGNETKQIGTKYTWNAWDLSVSWAMKKQIEK